MFARQVDFAGEIWMFVDHISFPLFTGLFSQVLVGYRDDPWNLYRHGSQVIIARVAPPNMIFGYFMGPAHPEVATSLFIFRIYESMRAAVFIRLRRSSLPRNPKNRKNAGREPKKRLWKAVKGCKTPVFFNQHWEWIILSNPTGVYQIHNFTDGTSAFHGLTLRFSWLNSWIPGFHDVTSVFLVTPFFSLMDDLP